MKKSTAFIKDGILIGLFFLLLEYLLLEILYVGLDANEWIFGPPFKYYFFINYLLFFCLILILFKRKELWLEILENKSSYPDLRENIGLYVGLSIFGVGSFIVYNIIKSYWLMSSDIYAFENNNLYVKAVLNIYSIGQVLIYPIFIAFVYQGFLLGQLSSLLTFRKASVIVAVLAGILSQDVIGVFMYTLFANHIYETSKNILYPIVLNIIVNMFFIFGYVLWPDYWLLNTDPHHKSIDMVKGIIMMLLGLPFVVIVWKKHFTQDNNTTKLDL